MSAPLLGVAHPLASPRPRTLVLFPYGWSVRNYLRSGFMELLAGSCDIIAALRVCEEPLATEFLAHAHRVVALPDLRIPAGTRALTVLMNMAHERRRPQLALRLRRARLLRAAPWTKRLALVGTDGIAWVIAHTAFSVAARAESRLVLRALRDSDAKRLMDECRPDALLSTAPFVPADAALARLAQAAGIPSAAAVLSWDNPSSKSRMPALFDRYFVWSEEMARDLIAHYPEIDRGRISVTGTPQFDFHGRPAALSRAEFCEALDLDPERPIIAYTASTARLLPGEEWIVERLCDAIEAGMLPGAPHLLVRLHPQDQGSRFDAVQRRGVRVMRPWAFRADRPSWSYPTARDLDVLTGTLWHAAVNVNFFSTMTLDFALCDTPVVNVAIETPASRAAGIDVALFYRYEHYRPVLEENAVRLARTIDELVEHVRSYLLDRSLERRARRRLVERLCGPLDGRAAERIATELAGLAAARPRR